MRSIITLPLLFVFVSICFSCKKDRACKHSVEFTDELSFLKDEWILIKVVEISTYTGNGDVQRDTITNFSESYEFEFSENDLVFLKKGDQVIDEDCLTLNSNNEFTDSEGKSAIQFNFISLIESSKQLKIIYKYDNEIILSHVGYPLPYSDNLTDNYDYTYLFIFNK